MALHGEVKVNHEVVGMWEARRLSRQPLEGANVYQCRVERLIEGEWELVEFRLAHDRDDGALFLAQKVLQIGNDYLNGKKARD